jgi:hypothetical protein
MPAMTASAAATARSWPRRQPAASPATALDLDYVQCEAPRRPLDHEIAARSASRSGPTGDNMNGTIDMSTPVTRSELKEELGSLESRFDQKLGSLESSFDQKLDSLESRIDRKLDLWGGALLDRIIASERRLLDELARHTGAIHELLSKNISVVDDKYRDLPDRVHRLETEVFAPDDESRRKR